ncbi:leucine-rich repeat flightless-interacting protein 1-like isoform X3 [Ictalurus furcatus]|uniref:leucine-rich repeat flightless-interacting protein 1-like isoform X3 n=1 Tax=Ictalurus furcatus TaxID=66913 RepID=UPI0023506C01|nr:leucine-rich repeat flightless-interacting protein 1-like isoform X3 [Ictalurus furcatus]
MKRFLNALNAGEETTVDPEDTPEVYLLQRPVRKWEYLCCRASPGSDVENHAVCVQGTEPALVQPAEVPQDQVMDSVTPADEKMQKLVVCSTQLEESMRELEELLCEACRDDLESKSSIAKLEEKHQKAEETIAQLEAEKAILTNQVEKLQGTLQNMGNMLTETHRECDELTDEYEREQEAHSILQKESDEMKETLTQKEELLQVSLAEAEEKYQKAEESIAQLEVEKANLTNQVEKLQEKVQNIENMLTESRRECEALMNEYERKQEAHSILKELEMKNNEMKQTLMEKEELLKTPCQKLRSNTRRLFQRQRQRSTS